MKWKWWMYATWWINLIRNRDWSALQYNFLQPLATCLSIWILLGIILKKNWSEIKQAVSNNFVSATVGAVLGGLICAFLGGIILVFVFWSLLYPLGALTGFIAGSFMGGYIGIQVSNKLKTFLQRRNDTGERH